MIKIILVREATDREPNFATTEVSEIKSDLEKKIPSIGSRREWPFDTLQCNLVIKLSFLPAISA